MSLPIARHRRSAFVVATIQTRSMMVAVAMLVAMSAAMFAPEPAQPARPPASLVQAVVGPLRDFFRRPGALAMLALIFLYKFGDALAGTLTTAFLIRGVGFSPFDVGAVNKGLGLASLLLGALVGGALLARMRLVPALQQHLGAALPPRGPPAVNLAAHESENH